MPLRLPQLPQQGVLQPGHRRLDAAPAPGVRQGLGEVVEAFREQLIAIQQQRAMPPAQVAKRGQPCGALDMLRQAA